MKRYFNLILLISFSLLILSNCFTAGISVINSYYGSIWGPDKRILQIAFNQLWEKYPFIRLSETDKYQIIKYNNPIFSEIRKKNDSVSINSNPKFLYPAITKLTNNSVDYVFYFVKSKDCKVIYTVWVGNYGYSLLNCIDLKDNKIISSGNRNADKKIIKSYRKKFEDEIKTKLDSIIKQSR